MLSENLKDYIIGVIYNRPIAINNLTFFVVIERSALIKGISSNPNLIHSWSTTIIYLIL